MIAIYITSIVLGIISMGIMLYVLKVNFERKDDMLKLFQFGLVGFILLHILNSMSVLSEYCVDLHTPSKTDLYGHLMNALVYFLIVPYFLFAKRKNKKI